MNAALEPEALLDCCAVLERERDQLVPRAWALLAPRTGGAAPEAGRRYMTALIDSLRRASGGDWATFDLLVGGLAAALGDSGQPFGRACAAAGDCAALLADRVLAAHAHQPERLGRALRATHALLGRVAGALGEEALRAQARATSERETRAQHALQASERRFARLFESGLLCVLVCDLVGNIKDANDAFLAMVGYTREELTSGMVRWSEMTPPEWAHLDDEAVRQLKASGVAHPWEKEYLRKDGSRVPILVGVAMLDDEECIAFALDISERKRLEQLRVRAMELETQNRRIQEASRMKSEFLANMSHELRTPLNSILGFAGLLHDGEVSTSSPQHREFLGDILKSGWHLLQLINDVLDLAKVEAGKLEFHPQPVDLEEICRETVTVLRSVAAAKRIALEVDVDPTVGALFVDPGRLKQVLYNYLSNAVKFTGEGGRVTVRARPEGGGCFRLEVEDNGIGIAAQDVDRLFVEFQQLDAGMTKRHQGTGLGLALTRRIVEAQGGTVGVDSLLGRGSTFHATLPCRAAAARAPEDGPLCPPGDQAAVLVVEDDPRDRRLLTQTLNRAGYTVEATGSGVEAMALCRERVYNAVTLDLLLPDTTGLEVLHSVRTDGVNRTTPVLIVSVVAERGIVGGYAVQDYLRKPIDGPELLASLARAGATPERDRSILVVDDDPGALKLAAATLRRLGYQPVCQQEGGPALAALESSRPSAIILDLLMPGMDGFEFLSRLRGDPGNRHLPVIVWTMKDLSREEHSRLHLLAQGVVVKGEAGAHSLVEQLRALLPDRPAAEGQR
jgi:PAS domain S-box-containing protein